MSYEYKKMTTLDNIIFIFMIFIIVITLIKIMKIKMILSRVL